jgi:hypothetical protein
MGDVADRHPAFERLVAVGRVAPVEHGKQEAGGKEQGDQRRAQKTAEQQAMALPKYRESRPLSFPTEFSMSPEAGLDSRGLWLSIVRDHLNGKGTLRQ